MPTALAIVGGAVVAWWLLRFLLAFALVTQRNRRIAQYETERFIERGSRQSTPEEMRRDMIHIWTQYHGVPRVEAERRYDQLERGRSQRPAISASVTSTDAATSREMLIQGAATSLLRHGLPLPQLDEFSREILAIYGHEWLEENEELLRAMLAFVEDFQVLEDDSTGLREFLADDARECCLLNIFSCMRLAGAFTQPTIPKQRPDVADFMLAFSRGDLTTVDDPKSTMFALGLAVRFASQAAEVA